MMKKLVFGLAGFFMLASLSLAAQDTFSVDGVPLEMMCLADDQHSQFECVRYIQTLLDHDWVNRDNPPKQNPMVRCYYGELLTLRNVGIWGYREILETFKWIETRDGKARTASYAEFTRAARDFVARIEPARNAIRKARETRKMRWSCRLSRHLRN